MNRLIPHACSPFPFPTLTNKTHFFLLLPKPNPSHSHTHKISFSRRRFMTDRDNPDMKEFMCYMESLKNNYEKSGVPKGAGTDSDDGFDLSRMKTLLGLLGNPHHNFKAVHIAGTKGKGSTAAFVSNILRAEGYSVGCYSSPHVQTIRERMSLGRSGDPVSARVLNGLFLSIRSVLDQAMQLEKGSISHFEVLTAMAFALFARENVDIAVVEAGLGGARDATNIIDSSGLAAAVITTIGEEHMAALGGSLESIAVAKSGIIKQGCPVVLGGPFLPHINHILHDKASMMNAPVISVSDAVNRSTIKGLRDISGKPCQCCDIDIQTKGDFQLIYKLSNVNLRLIGSHQLQNAATATCTALCLRELGWRISDDSIKAGLEQTYLIGRSQFLTSKETESLGLPGARILLDGAHTKDSAKALIDTIQMTYPETQIALVVAMASDKDHLAFAKEFLSGTQLKAVILTEASIAGGKSRTTPATSLKDSWIQGSKELGISVVKDEVVNYHGEPLDGPIITTESSAETSLGIANRLIQHKLASRTGLIVVTGSLHIVSAILASLDV